MKKVEEFDASDSVGGLIIQTVLQLFDHFTSFAQVLIGISFFVMNYITTTCITLIDETNGIAPIVCSMVDKSWYIKRVTEGRQMWKEGKICFNTGAILACFCMRHENGKL